MVGRVAHSQLLQVCKVRIDHPGFPRIVSALTLKIPHLVKSLSPEQPEGQKWFQNGGPASAHCLTKVPSILLPKELMVTKCLNSRRHEAGYCQSQDSSAL